MLVTTVNVNGLRAAVRKGMGEWVAEANPDVLLLQEVRAPEELVEDLVGPAYHVVRHASELAGRAGVAIALRKGLEVGRVSMGLSGDEPPVDTGRWLEVEVPELRTTFVSAYLHSGDAANKDKMAAKYAHLDAVSARLQVLLEDDSDVLVAGDFNIVHKPEDITNWKSNHNKTSGVLDDEIAYLDRWFGEFGLVDTQRKLTGDAQADYTWWSQRGKAFDNNTGWRIDYQMTSTALADAATEFSIFRAPSYDTRWSDHAPLTIAYDR